MGLIMASASAYDSNICCMKAARLPQIRIPLDEYPWDACSLNDTETYPEGKTFPSINVTMGWCKAHCPGSQQSDLSQWLQPLTSWVVPYIGLLLLCPFGDIKEPSDKQFDEPPKEALAMQFWRLLRKYTQEWVNLLGDPGSAIFGAFSEIWSDATMLREINMRHRESKEELSSGGSWLELLRWVVVLAGDTEFTQGSQSRRRQRRNKRASQQRRDQKDAHLLLKERAIEFTPWVASQPDKGVDDSPDLHAMVENAIRTHIEARTDFFKAVFLPTILFLAVTASVFYDAYTKLGDNDTANGLAFGIWYSWLVILSVAANCFASSVNAGLTETTLGRYIKLAKRSVPLRERYFNSMLWDEWLACIETDSEQTLSGLPSGNVLLLKVKEELILKSQSHPVKFSTLTLGKASQLLVGHVFAWFCVAIPTAGAIVVSYNTPTVGLDCRSFNFLLYGVIALVVSPLHIAYQWVHRNHGNKYLEQGIKISYWLLVCANAAILTIGTILQLSGVYRSCQCQLLFASDSELVEVNHNTQLALDNAKTYWLPVGYVAFGFVWVVCGLLTAARKYITIHLVDE